MSKEIEAMAMERLKTAEARQAEATKEFRILLSSSQQDMVTNTVITFVAGIILLAGLGIALLAFL